MRRLLLFFFALLIFHSSVYAQYDAPQNSVWIFGLHARLDFVSGTPVTGGTFPANAVEGGASVCDASGNLLFYTDGDTVYNRLGLVMPFGRDIVPYETSSSEQSALIVPFIDNPDKYYIFSNEYDYYGTFADLNHRLSYSVVDMRLDGGLGDLVAGETAIFLNDHSSEKLISVRGDNCNIWVIMHKDDTNVFCVYEITSSGISAPTLYSIGTYDGGTGLGGIADRPYTMGGMAISHDRRTLFMSSFRGSTGPLFCGELFDFNPATGVISNCRVLSLTEGYYGAEFSPDNTKLYVTSAHNFYVGDGSLIQYDLSLPSLAAIQASRTIIKPLRMRELRLGPDNRIYVVRNGGSMLDRIDFPNAAAGGCGYSESVLSVAPGAATWGFGNVYWGILPTPELSEFSSICTGDTLLVTASVGGGVWSSSNTTVATIDTAGVVIGIAPGTTTIQYSPPGGCNVQAVLTVNPQPGPHVPDMPIWCSGYTLSFSHPLGGGTWSSSDVSVVSVDVGSGEAMGVSAGTAIMTYSIGGCFVTRVATVNPTPEPFICPAFICTGDLITLSTASTGGFWTTADTAVADIGYYSGTMEGKNIGSTAVRYSFPITGCYREESFSVSDCELGFGGAPLLGSVTVFPIPAGDNIRIVYNSGFDPGTNAAIYDMAGKLLQRSEMYGREVVLATSALPSGVYQLVINGTDNSIIYRRLLIKK